MSGFTSRMRQRIERAGRLASIGATLPQSIKLVSLSNLFLLQRWLGAPQWPHAEVRIEGPRGPVGLVVTSAADIGVLEEIFVRLDYDATLVREPKIIVDLGSNIGASVAFFRLRYPKAEILAFEPAARTFAQLATNTGRFPAVRIFNEAVTSVTGHAILHSTPYRSAGASLIVRATNTESEQIRTVSLDDVFKREQLEWIDLLKFDIEGCELEMFRACGHRERIGELVGEYHADLVGDELSTFLSLFPRFKCTELAVHGGRHLIHLVNPLLLP